MQDPGSGNREFVFSLHNVHAEAALVLYLVGVASDKLWLAVDHIPSGRLSTHDNELSSRIAHYVGNPSRHGIVVSEIEI